MPMSTFADRVQTSIVKNRSHLVAGFDPILEKLPQFILQGVAQKAATDGEMIEMALAIFRDAFITAISDRVAAVKPNIAFFEQYGLPGIKAFADFCSAVREREMPLIIDAKRGDIGSTATAYSAAFLGQVTLAGKKVAGFEGDALTVNPFLGFDTLEPFMKDCQEFGKGIFVLVRTSNPGATDLQGLRANEISVSDHVADWIARNAEKLLGSCGWSGLGAVVGASYPEDAVKLRQRMPRSFFLIPGFGAQGSDAKDSIAGFGSLNGERGGALVNVSRGLLEGKANSSEEFVSLIRANADRFNSELNQALAGR